MQYKYKAILYETPRIVDAMYVPNKTQAELNKPKSVDVFYLNEKSYKAAEHYFFVRRGWIREAASYHIKFEEGLDI